MGSVLSCENCWAGSVSTEDLDAAKERIARLQKGDKFLRSALLGLSSQELLLKLSDDISKVEWKIINNTWTSNEWGEIDLTSQLKTLKLLGSKGMQFIGTLEDKVLLEVQSEEASTRDHWVLSINELLQVRLTLFSLNHNHYLLHVVSDRRRPTHHSWCQADSRFLVAISFK